MKKALGNTLITRAAALPADTYRLFCGSFSLLLGSDYPHAPPCEKHGGKGLVSHCELRHCPKFLCTMYPIPYKSPSEEVWSDMINTENVVSLWHAASSSHFTHTCTSTSLYTLLQMLSLPHPQIKAHVDPCKADTLETGPEVPGARREFVFGLQLEARSAG